MLKDLSARTEESVTLAVAKHFNLVYVDQVDPPNMMSPNWLDMPLPLHATSGGKAFLAWLGPDERAAILPEELQRYTPPTIRGREPGLGGGEPGDRVPASGRHRHHPFGIDADVQEQQLAGGRDRTGGCLRHLVEDVQPLLVGAEQVCARPGTRPAAAPAR